MVKLVGLTVVAVPGVTSIVSGLLSLSVSWTRTPRKCAKRSSAGTSVSPANSGGSPLACHPACPAAHGAPDHAPGPPPEKGPMARALLTRSPPTPTRARTRAKEVAATASGKRKRCIGVLLVGRLLTVCAADVVGPSVACRRCVATPRRAARLAYDAR